MFTYQNKALPGSYISFVSVSSASAAVAERGYAAIALSLPWGPSGEVFTVTSEDFYSKTAELFACDYTHPTLAGLRDLFLYANTCYIYRLGIGAEKASAELATARYPGTRGNEITLVVSEDSGVFCVETYLAGILKDRQTVMGAAELVGNSFVDFDSSAALAATAGLPLTGGSDGTATTEAYQCFLDALEGYSFHAVGCLSTDETVKRLFADYTKRMRDEVGAKFQCVLHRYPDAGCEGVISVENAVDGHGDDAAAVYWVTGVSAGCPLNRSNTNRLYDGEFDIDTPYTQTQLEALIKNGSFVFHKVSGKVRVLEDINTFASFSIEKSSDFSINQTIRILDQISMDIAALFCSRYLGVVPNDNAGRISLWNEIVSRHQKLQTARAIEDFSPEHVSVSQGDSKKSVVVTDRVTPVCAMSQLYMTVIVG